MLSSRIQALATETTACRHQLLTLSPVPRWYVPYALRACHADAATMQDCAVCYLAERAAINAPAPMSIVLTQ